MLWQDMVPVVKETDLNGKTTEVNIIAGKHNGIQAPNPTPDSWAANSKNSVSVLTIKMEPNAIWKLPGVNENVTRTLYFYSGDTISIDSQTVDEYHLIEVNPKGNLIIQNGKKDGYLLMLQGKPINESVVQHGPFVMNTQQEIQDAFSDYRKTQFGGWPWSNQEPVHNSKKGRFALHADGTEELK